MVQIGGKICSIFTRILHFEEEVELISLHLAERRDRSEDSIYLSIKIQRRHP